MGVVYEALDLNLDRHVAIKFLNASLSHNEEARARFSQEARTASALDDPAICTIYEIDQTDDGRIFLVMTFYEGKTLDNHIKVAPLSIIKVIEISIQIARGLANAHKNGIVHRDIKPANIMLLPDGRVKILDFGLAKLAGQPGITEEHTSYGTTNYMSPEQAQGGLIDDRTDIWSLGVLIWEAITGKFPFRGEYEQAIIYNILNQDAEPLGKYRKKVPQLIEQVMLKSLAKRPGDRYQTVYEMLADLENAKEALEKGTDSGIDPQYKIKRFKIKEIPNSVAYAMIGLLLIFIFYLLFEPADVEKSITVLPFASLNNPAEPDYFSDGITEDIVVQLSKIKNLKVIAYQRNSYYKNTDQSLAELGKTLNVSYILTGSVRRHENKVRITAELIQAEGGEQIWAETYDRDLREIFKIQSEVAKMISSALAVSVSPEEKNRINKTYTRNLTAYDYYLQGRNYYSLFREADNQAAIQLFKKAVQTDPSFALAYAGLADAFAQRALRFSGAASWLDSAVTRANQALQLEQNLAEAHKALGLVYYTRSWFDQSLRENLTALEYNPNLYFAMHNIGWINLNRGDIKTAIAWFEKARTLNPAFGATYLGLGTAYMIFGKAEQSGSYLRTALEIQPDLKPNPMILQIMSALMVRKTGDAQRIGSRLLMADSSDVWNIITAADMALHSGDPLQAGELYNRAMQINPSAFQPVTGVNASTSMGFILRKTGHIAAADEMLAYSFRLDSLSLEQGSEWWGIAYDIAAIYAAKGLADESVKWLQQAVRKGFRLYRWLRIDPLFESLWQNREFITLVNRSDFSSPDDD